MTIKNPLTSNNSEIRQCLIKPSFVSVLTVFLFLAFFCPSISSQISSHVDCRILSKNSKNFGPLTRDEKINSVTSKFSTEISRFEECEERNRQESETHTKKEQGSEKKSSDLQTKLKNDPLQEEHHLLDSQKEKTKPLFKAINKSISSNTIGAEGRSISITTGGRQISDDSRPSPQKRPSQLIDLEKPTSINGKQHEELEKSNNLKILKEQIKAQAENETDPKVKAELMKKYMEL